MYATFRYLEESKDTIPDNTLIIKRSREAGNCVFLPAAKPEMSRLEAQKLFSPGAILRHMAGWSPPYFLSAAGLI